MSSMAVTSVTSEPFADDVRLKAGDGKLSKLSDLYAPPEMDLVSLGLLNMEGAVRDPAEALCRSPYSDVLALGLRRRLFRGEV